MSHEVLGRLAVGGMAELYIARTAHADGSREIVVLKRILPHLAEDPEFVRMFRDEAYLAATLDHPNIVHVHDIGHDGDDYFFTMEYVHGENVRTIIKAAQKREVSLPLDAVIQIALGVCEGLHYAHEQVDEDGSPLRIVHRDVSPTNILVSYDGEVKIVDFGIAKAAAATHVTQAGMLKGKASYMSPEQCRAEPVDRRSDVFAIGILIFEMTTLTRLFRGENELAVLHQILTGEVEAPSSRVDDYPPELERIVLKALSHRPADRYPTTEAMYDDLLLFAQSHGLVPTSDGLAEMLLDLCGERPYPLLEDEDEDDPLVLDEGDQSTSSMPTSTGSYDDDEDTQVNRRAADLRTLVPGGAARWPGDEGEEEPEVITGTTNRRILPGGVAAAPRAGASRVGGPAKPAPTMPAPGGTPPAHAPPRPDAAAASARVAATGPTAPQSVVMTAAPPGSGPTRPIVHRPTATSGKAVPSAASGPGAAPRREGAAAPLHAQSGRTLGAGGGGRAGPAPPRSGRTIPGLATTPGPPVSTPTGAQRASSPSSAPAPQPSPAHSPTFGTDQTVAAGAGSGLPLSRPPEPPASASPAAAPDHTVAFTPDEAQALALAGKAANPPERPASGVGSPPWSRPTPGKTLLATGPGRRDIDEGARTIALPGRGPDSPPLPKGPMTWGTASEDPLLQTQKTPIEQSPAARFPGTLPRPVASMTSTQRSPSAVYPDVNAAAELRRPEMRSPSPRPESTPRSLWVPILVVLIIALAGTAAWLWYSGKGLGF